MKDQVKSAYKKVMHEINPKMENFPWENRQTYGHWLAQTNYFVSHSVRLLGLCLSRIPVKQKALHQRLADHIGEESGHEILAERDIVRMGQEVKDFPELPSTKAFYGLQYYAIEHIDPAYLFGYILFLEGLAIEAGRTAYKRALEAFGERSTTFLKVHVEEDVGHVESALLEIEKMSPEQVNLVLDSMHVACRLYSHILTEITENCHSVKRSSDSPELMASL